MTDNDRIDTLAQTIRKELRGAWCDLIAIKGHLNAPYPDDPRWTPWTRFGESASCAIERARQLTDELERLLEQRTQERDEARDECHRREQITRDEMRRADEYTDAYRAAETDLEKARERVRELEAALREIASWLEDRQDPPRYAAEIAREALR